MALGLHVADRSLTNVLDRNPPFQPHPTCRRPQHCFCFLLQLSACSPRARSLTQLTHRMSGKLTELVGHYAFSDESALLAAASAFFGQLICARKSRQTSQSGNTINN